MKITSTVNLFSRHYVFLFNLGNIYLLNVQVDVLVVVGLVDAIQDPVAPSRTAPEKVYSTHHHDINSSSVQNAKT
jgi:hypothetical protein